MLSLILSADLQGVTALKPTDTEDNPYFYSFRVKCTGCHEEHPNWVSFNRFEQHEIPGSRGEANFVWKCRLCGKTHSASVISGPHSVEMKQDKRKGQKIIDMDCRGLEFTEFKPDGEWEAKGVESGTSFSAIDLMEEEWYDYDEKAGEEVSIKELKWDVGRA